jgi:hypothetical protein
VQEVLQEAESSKLFEDRRLCHMIDFTYVRKLLCSFEYDELAVFDAMCQEIVAAAHQSRRRRVFGRAEELCSLENDLFAFGISYSNSLTVGVRMSFFSFREASDRLYLYLYSIIYLNMPHL